MAFIYSVAINDSGQGILGGQGSSGVAYAAIVPPSGIAVPINIGTTLPFSEIYSVAINDSGQGIIGGATSEVLAYAAFVSPSGIATPIDIGLSEAISSIGLRSTILAKGLSEAKMATTTPMLPLLSLLVKRYQLHLTRRHYQWRCDQ